MSMCISFENYPFQGLVEEGLYDTTIELHKYMPYVYMYVCRCVLMYVLHF